MPSEKVIPSGCRIKFKSKNNFERNIIRNAEQQLVYNRIRDYQNKIEHLGNEIKVRKNSLKHSIENDMLSTQIEQFLLQSKEKTFRSTRSTQIKKTK